ncbi:MAG: hypothetical protein ABRQ25_09870 [Clostridiaceae bacterium]
MSNWQQTNTYEVITEYSLDNHLKKLCEIDEKYKNLYAVWTLDKEIYSKALTAVPMTFPHYSLHESSHSISIINKIEMLLGEDRIKSLSATDTFMILESAFLHDFGMIVIDEQIKKEWKEPRFKRYLKSLSENSFDRDISEAAAYILKIEKQNINISKKEEFICPLKIKECVTLVIADYFRGKHGSNSAMWIHDSDELNLIINSNDLVPKRIMNLIGKISISHNIDFCNVIETLEYESNGFGTDRIHPRFIACMLRMGDLLDLDNGRFNPILEKMSFMPETSRLHKEKHGAITHLLVCPRKIEVSAQCENDKVYRTTREWFSWLEEELKNLSSKWADIVPPNFQGGPPSLGDINLNIIGEEQIKGQLKFEFSIDQKRAFELIEGSGIYNDKLIFIRELIQNAMDATKIQIWRDIKNGRFDEIPIKGLNLKTFSKESLDNIYEIPKEIIDFYPIKISVFIDKFVNEQSSYDSNSKCNETIYKFVIEDRGCGISLNDLKRMEKVGGSWNSDDGYVDFVEKMPYWFQPTGNFGIGLHSIFLITDEVEFETKSENDKAYKIGFVSRRQNGYITIKSNKEFSVKNGTRITVSIEESKIKAALEEVNHFKYLNRYTYDIFDENIETRKIVGYLKAYIKNLMDNIHILKFQWNIENEPDENYLYNSSLLRMDTKDASNAVLFQDRVVSCDNNISVHCYNVIRGSYRCFQAELVDNDLGIVVKMEPIGCENEDMMNKYFRSHESYYLRIFYKEVQTNSDICPGNSYFKGEFYIWKEEAKNILDVARNNVKTSIVKKYKQYFEERIIPIFIIKMLDYIKEESERDHSYKSSIADKCLFIFRLALLNYLDNKQIGLYPFINSLGNETILEGLSKFEYVKKDDGNNILINKNVLSGDLFTCNKIIIAPHYYELNEYSSDNFISELNISNIEEYLITHTYGFDIINKYIRKFFVIDKIKYYEKKKINILLLKREIPNDNKFIKVSKDSLEYKTNLKSLFSNGIIRATIYPLKHDGIKLLDNLIVDKLPTGFNNNYFEYMKYYIISPFINTNAELNQYSCFNHQLEEYLNNKANFQELVRWVASNAVNKNNSEDLVKEAYKELIEEYFSISKHGDEFCDNVSVKQEFSEVDDMQTKNEEECNKDSSLKESAIEKIDT